jgi:hypothetical protein
MSSTLFNNHPLIPNSNQYFWERKYVSIHSQDRDISKYPSSSFFEIELPQDYLNIASAKLYSWSFPANYNVFSVNNYNISMSFKLTQLYNPGEYGVSDPLLEGIFAALYNYNNQDKEYVIIIEPGFYNPQQMSTELTNKFNERVTLEITNFLKDNSQYEEAYNLFIKTQYNRFNIVYNSVEQKLWFGNTADRFVLINDSNIFYKKELVDASCLRKNELPDFSSWGLPAYLGFTRCSVYSLNADETLEVSLGETEQLGNSAYQIALNEQKVPRFYYGDVGNGDNGYWLLPGAPGATVYFLKAQFKISFMGPAYFYMEIDGLNCIDETSPWNLSLYTTQTNNTNGVVNSSFAKIPIPTTPISQYFDNDMNPYKYFNPPAERIRKLKIKLRYHNGQLIDFGQFEYSFMLEFSLLKPQQERSYSIRGAYDLYQVQSYGKNSSL